MRNMYISYHGNKYYTSNNVLLRVYGCVLFDVLHHTEYVQQYYITRNTYSSLSTRTCSYDSGH